MLSGEEYIGLIMCKKTRALGRCLQLRTSDEPPDSSEGGPSSVPQVHRAVQISILKLLSSCVDGPAPNIAHFLLGFETGSNKSVSETTLQDPGE